MDKTSRFNISLVEIDTMESGYGVTIVLQVGNCV